MYKYKSKRKIKKRTIALIDNDKRNRKFFIKNHKSEFKIKLYDSGVSNKEILESGADLILVDCYINDRMYQEKSFGMGEIPDLGQCHNQKLFKKKLKELNSFKKLKLSKLLYIFKNENKKKVHRRGIENTAKIQVALDNFQKLKRYSRNNINLVWSDGGIDKAISIASSSKYIMDINRPPIAIYSKYGRKLMGLFNYIELDKHDIKFVRKSKEFNISKLRNDQKYDERQSFNKIIDYFDDKKHMEKRRQKIYKDKIRLLNRNIKHQLKVYNYSMEKEKRAVFYKTVLCCTIFMTLLFLFFTKNFVVIESKISLSSLQFSVQKIISFCGIIVTFVKGRNIYKKIGEKFIDIDELFEPLYDDNLSS